MKPRQTIHTVMGRPLRAAAIFSLVALLWAACSKDAISSEGNGDDKASRARPASAQKRAGAPATADSAAALAGPHHPVYSLVDNRVLAHLVRQGGLFVPVGHPGVAKYATFRRPWKPWRFNHKVDNRPVALASRSVTWLEVPLTVEQAKASHLSMSLNSPKPQGLVVSINGRRVKPIRLSTGWAVVSTQIPAGTLKPGENRIEMSWGATGRINGKRATAAMEWLHLGTAPLDTVSAVFPAEGGDLVLPKAGGAAYYVYPYAGAKLRIRASENGAQGDCELVVRMAAEGARAVEKAQTLGAASQAVVDLAPITGRVGRLELTARGDRCQGLRLVEASILMPGEAPKVKHPKRPKNVLFWLIDNVRADRYSLYNADSRVKTPVITELGKTGTVFQRAYIQGTESRVSHAAIWTGLYPKQHRFVAPKARLSLSWTTLPEGARKAGLTTAAWIANGFVSKFWGFGEGWDVFKNHLHEGGGLTAKALADRAIEFIGKAQNPFYIYVGTIDVHVSWRGRQPWLNEYYPEPYQGPFKRVVFGKEVEKMASGRRQTSATDRKRIIAIYDSTVSYNDQHLGRVLDALKEKGVRDDTMIIITADHGEELWDFGRIGHGSSLREQLVAVPLIIHYPPLFGSGVKVEQGVDVLSVMPTVLDALGVPIPDEVQGESLIPLAQGVGTGYPRPAFASQYELAHTMRLERWKLWVGGKGEPKLFDMDSKASEHKEVGAEHPLALRWLTDSLSTFLIYQNRWRVSRWGVASNHKAALAQDLESGKKPERIRPR